MGAFGTAPNKGLISKKTFETITPNRGTKDRQRDTAKETLLKKPIRYIKRASVTPIQYTATAQNK